MTEEFTITTNDAGMRLDKYLVLHLKSVSRGDVIRMIRARTIEVNGKGVKPSYILKGDEYIFIGEYKDPSKKILPNRNLSIDVIEGTDDMIIINKQKGVQVHPSHRERYETMVNALLARFPEIRGVGEDEDRPGIVHRLDKDTTGLMVIARHQRSFEELKDIFQSRRAHKVYYALVFGHLDSMEGEVDAPIARATSYTKQKIAFGKYKGESKEAITQYRVMKSYYLPSGIDISLVELRPKTGRMHQIRVHMSHIGHPLIGDQRYYTKIQKKLSLTIPKEYEPHTFYLHAKELSFPLFGKDHTYTVRYPERFSALLRYLERHEV